MKFKGLTLIELVLVITMLGILLGITIMVLDPRKQMAKVNDTTRKRDIQEIKTALDTYYNDHNCYPTTLPFGSAWQENSTVYMRKVPQDVACANNTNCYVYKYLGSCPQWNVVFTKLSVTPTTPQCTLTSHSACVPSDYSNSWACIVSGNVDAAGCAHLAASSLSGGSDGGLGGNDSGSQPPPPPPPPPADCSQKDWICSGDTCNHTTAGAGVYCSSTCDGFCKGR